MKGGGAPSTSHESRIHSQVFMHPKIQSRVKFFSSHFHAHVPPFYWKVNIMVAFIIAMMAGLARPFLADVPNAAAALSPAERQTAGALQRRLCLSDAETVRLLISNPSVLDLSLSGKIAPAIDTLQSTLQLDDRTLGKVVRASPQVLSLSVDQTLLPRLATLKARLQLSNGELSSLVVRFPRLLVLADGNVEAKMRALAGAPLRASDDQIRTIVLTFPQVVSLSVEANLQPSLTALSEMLALGEDELRALVLTLPTLLGLSVEGNLRPKLRFLSEALGWGASELREGVLRCPSVLGASLEKSLRPNVELWKAHLAEADELSSLAEIHGLRFLCCSFEKRTVPRMASMRACGMPATALVTRLRLTDMAFEEWLVVQRLSGPKSERVDRGAREPELSPSSARAQPERVGIRSRASLSRSSSV